MLFLLCVRQQLGYFFFRKRVKCSAILYFLPKQHNLVLRASRLVVHSSGGYIYANYCRHFPKSADTFQILTTLASYEELSLRFEPIGNGEILFYRNNKYFSWTASAPPWI